MRQARERRRAEIDAKLDAMPSIGFVYAMTALTVVGTLGGVAIGLWLLS